MTQNGLASATHFVTPMQIAALNNPVAGKMVPAAAKAPATASGDFSSALATAFASVSPGGTALASGNNAAAPPKQMSELACGAKVSPPSALEPAGITAVNADPYLPLATDPQPVRKPDSKTEAERKEKPDDTAGNSQSALSTTAFARPSDPPAPVSIVVPTPPPPLSLPVPAPAESVTATTGDGSRVTGHRSPKAAVVSEDFGEATATTRADLVQEMASSPTAADFAPTDRPTANKPAQKQAPAIGNARLTEVPPQQGVPTTPSVEAQPAPSPWSVPVTITVTTTTKIPEADAWQAACIEAPLAPQPPADFCNTPNLVVHPENRPDNTHSPLPAAAVVVSLNASVLQTTSNASAAGNPSLMANAQEAIVPPLVQQPEHSTGPSPARSPASAPQNPEPMAAPSPRVDKPSDPISKAPDRNLPDASAPRQFQTSTQGLVPATNVAANVPASLARNIPSSIANLATNDPGNTPAPAAEAAPDSKQLPEPPATTQKKSPAPESEDAVAASAAFRTVVPDTGVATPAPGAPNPVAPQAPHPTKAEQTPESPKTQQMLDSAPPAPQAPSNASFTPTQAADVQMHVGLRTTAFGAVEIHTTVVQNQVGIAVHGDRSLAHWFSSEVPGLESGLKDHSMNLAAIHVDSGRSGVETATSFHHRSPQRNWSQAIAAPAVFEDSEAASEASNSDSLLPDLATRPAGSRVSILV